MKRLHIHVSVGDVGQSIGFLFDIIRRGSFRGEARLCKMDA